MTAVPPPPFPPAGTPPPVPEGWKAQWSGEHKAWYFFNQATQQSTWENPLHKAPLPPSPPPYGNGSYPQRNTNLYDEDDKSSTARGFSPALGLAAGGLASRVFGHHNNSQTPPINEYSRPQPHSEGSAPLYIHAACFCDQDVTQKVRSMVTPQQSLSIRCDTLTYHFSDPWPGHVKQFSMLYSYGQQPWQLLACTEGPDTINLHPIHPVEKVRADFVQQPTSRVVAMVWGTSNAFGDAQTTTGRSSGMKMMEVEREGRLEATNAWMGFDGHYGIDKLAVVYYRKQDGNVGIATAREGETLRMPWNAFGGAI